MRPTIKEENSKRECMYIFFSSYFYMSPVFLLVWGLGILLFYTIRGIYRFLKTVIKVLREPNEETERSKVEDKVENAKLKDPEKYKKDLATARDFIQEMTDADDLEDLRQLVIDRQVEVALKH